jgi:hypothetical protein
MLNGMKTAGRQSWKDRSMSTKIQKHDIIVLIIRSEENIIKEIFSGLLKHACLFRTNKGVIKLAKTQRED